MDPDLAPEDIDPARPRQAPQAAVLGVIALGGVAGAEARYELGVAWPHTDGGWPWSTLVINITGCLLIGALMVLVLEVFDAHPLVRPLLGVGVLGGYTTFSTYAVDALALIRTGHYGLLAGYLVGTPILALAAAALGVRMCRAISSRVRSRDDGQDSDSEVTAEVTA
ncbi:MAG: hypothetical protein ABS81_03435 [Pseudonocardia sp. SCN 72-86]|nr:MAG: hypothetical protein ABS81_03435 [Pseudonocardia sp. SCN 72-86]